MRFLRMFSNAVIAGALGAVYLAMLFLQLNPEVPLYPMNLAPLVVTVGLSYGVHLVAFFYVVTVIRLILSAEFFSPGWVSLRVQSWLLVADAGGVAALMWLNLASYAPMLRHDTSRRMAAGAAALTVCALAFLSVALVHYSFGRRKGRVGGSVVALALVASLVLPLAARGPGASPPLFSRRLEIDQPVTPPRQAARVALILLDGGSLDFLSTATLQGKLPNFGRILDSGAAMHLATIRPTQPGPVWTAVATGKLPWKTGVRSAARFGIPAAPDALDLLPDNLFAQGLVSFGLIRATEHSSASLQARTLWSILASAGLSSGIVNWPLTSPAQPVRGYLVSDRFYRPADPWLEPDDPASIYPLDLLPTARSAGESVRRSPESGVLLAAFPTAGLRQQVAEGQPVLTDRMYEQISRTLDASLRPNLTAVRVRQLDFAGHEFLRYAMPAQFGDVTDEERRRYGTVLEQAYSRIDAMIGRALATLGPDDLLLVISGYGMEPMSIGKRLLERAIGDPERTGTHEGAPDGFMLAYGAAVAPGRKKVASVFDVAPTVLYYLGMPVGRDMDGYVRTDVFTRDFTDSRPMVFIPTYER
jgi:hypothetical protein